MNLSALNHLKLELQRKKEDAEKKKRSIEAHQITPLVKVEKEEESSSSAGKKLPELTAEEQEKAKKARDILEAKAKLYDSLSEGVHLTKNSNLYLVNFEQKAVEDFRTPSCDSASDPNRIIDLAKNIKDEELDKQLKLKSTNENQEVKKCSDKELLLKARNLSSSDPSQKDESKPAEMSEPTLISADMQREKMRQKWEEDEKLARSKDEIHYQDILFDEVRGHGVGYFAFSKDEEERRRQQAELEEIRKETLRKQEEFRKLRGDISDESSTNKTSDESAEKEEPERELTEEEKLKNIEEALKAIRREVHVREWDKGKELPVMTQEEWIEKKRSERDTDFAPPEMYFENQGQGPKRKRPIQLPPRKTLFQKKPSPKDEKELGIEEISEEKPSPKDKKESEIGITSENQESDVGETSENQEDEPNLAGVSSSKTVQVSLWNMTVRSTPLPSEKSNLLPNPLQSEDSNLLPNPLRSENSSLLPNPLWSGNSNILPAFISKPSGLVSENVSSDLPKNGSPVGTFSNISKHQEISQSETNSNQVKKPKKSAMALLEEIKDSSSNSNEAAADTDNICGETVTSLPLPQDSGATLSSRTAPNNSSMSVSSVPLPPEKTSILPNANSEIKRPFFVPSNLIPRRFTSNVKPKLETAVTSTNSATSSVTMPSAVGSSSNKKLSNLSDDPKLSQYLKKPKDLEAVSSSNEVVTTSSNSSVSLPSAAESSSNRRQSNPLTDPKLSQYFKEPENLGASSSENVSNLPSSKHLQSDTKNKIPSDSGSSSTNDEGSRIKLGNLIKNRPAPKSGMALLEEIKKSTRDFGPEDESSDKSRFSRKRGAEIAPPDCLLHSTSQLPVRKKGLFSKKAEVSDAISAGLQTLKNVEDKKKKKTREKGLLDIL